MVCGVAWTAPVPEVRIFMILSIPNWTDRSLNRYRILSACSTVAGIPSFFHPSAVLVVRCHRYFHYFVFVLNDSSSYGSRAEEYLIVLGVTGTGTVVLAIAFFLAWVTAVTKLLRTS